ncbi:MAG: hypothetical protein KF838_07275 [Phycisphaeraceae bacterium]|nr:MAG: hypothetical protein KF838_07275 [Phycisphaeraceae bacterium]
MLLDLLGSLLFILLTRYGAMVDTLFLLAIVLVSGGAGGIGRAMASASPPVHKLRGHGKSEPVQIGWIADCYLGALSAACVGFVITSLLAIDLNNVLGNVNSINQNNLFRLIAISVISGYAGPAILDRQAQELLNRLNQLTKESERLKAQLDEKRRTDAIDSARASQRAEGVSYLDAGKFEQAEAVFRAIIHKYGETGDDLCNLATAIAYSMDPPVTPEKVQLSTLETAIALFDKALGLDPRHEKSIYNRACTKQAYRIACKAQGKSEKYTDDDVLADIAASAHIDPTNWDLAVNDPDLTSVRQKLLELKANSAVQ